MNGVVSVLAEFSLIQSVMCTDFNFDCFMLSLLRAPVGPSVGPSVGLSVRPSVGPSVRRSVRNAFVSNTRKPANSTSEEEGMSKGGRGRKEG